MFADLLASIMDGHTHLSLEFYANPSQLNTKSLLINTLQKSRAKLTVHGNSRTDDTSG
jgi:hypothetical protein